ncbi:MAG: SUMF1/EgtB/PvdO family nonheme iron enzyme [Verrucomicrobia bacterium]|nr:SUMF1/EgtB/PvdO family nonheme iron enzyme [Verrucomicrobiota bacterium]
MARQKILLFSATVCLLAGFLTAATPTITTNSIGIGLAKIPAGTFLMGQDSGGDWDESPAHQVKISKPFFISTTEVTLEQFRQFRPQHEASTAGKATGVSWHDAVAFCEWLSKKEGQPYRLPTEAEWEYACRAGTTTKFWSGENPPADAAAPNPWGLQYLYDSTLEWCADWHGPYRPEAQTDPVGPDSGLTRVVRGDKPDDDFVAEKSKEAVTPYYHRSANRAGLPPAFGLPAARHGSPPVRPANVKDEDWSPCGPHAVGFRVVQGEPLATPPAPAAVPFVRQGVKSPGALVKQAPPAGQPYFRKRFLLPTPPCPGNSPENGDSVRAGLHPSFRRHAHSPGLAACPNGDLLPVIYVSANDKKYCEYEIGVSLIAARLRFGADQWDMPDPMFDTPDANDHAPLLWTDWEAGGRMYFFWGSPQIARGAFPFQWMTSDNSGATWSEVHYPFFPGPIGPHTRQPRCHRRFLAAVGDEGQRADVVRHRRAQRRTPHHLLPVEG